MFENGFSKIISVDNQDVLYTKEYDENNDDAPMIGMEARKDGVIYKVRISLKTEEARDAFFQNLNDENARSFISEMNKYS